MEQGAGVVRAGVVREGVVREGVVSRGSESRGSKMCVANFISFSFSRINRVGQDQKKKN